jgi:2-polyprenyl-3-methyl-5-hydroxy-6-metoxy-1,4-benzoquinol methylase
MDKDNLNRLNEKISEIWDKNVMVRAKDLEDGTDYSYTKIIKPFIINAVYHFTTLTSTILDIGCGCGYLTNTVFQQNRHKITGIDISKKSVLYSKKRYPYIDFIHQDIYSMSRQKQYNMCLLVMTLNNIPDINTFFSIANEIIEPHGNIIIILPHPCFWPLKHLKEKYFTYAETKSYEIPFITKGRQDYSSSIIYFHRPMEVYVNCIENAGFKIIYCEEMIESTDGKNLPDILGLILEKCN